MGRSRSRDRGEADRIQKLVDERQQFHKDRDFDTADKIREELRDMGVQIDDSALTWRGPGGLEGSVAGSYGGGSGGITRRDGDWDCPKCGKLNFANRTECFACGEPKPDGRGGGDDRRRGDRYDDRDRRRRRDDDDDDDYEDRRGRRPRHWDDDDYDRDRDRDRRRRRRD